MTTELYISAVVILVIVATIVKYYRWKIKRLKKFHADDIELCRDKIKKLYKIKNNQ